jgi:nucleotide-binding universal stress UspA family protein
VIQNILVPLDGTPLAEAALPFASAIAARAGARLTLVRTAMYRTMFSDVAEEQMRALRCGEDYLVSLAVDLRAKGVPVDTRVPVGGSPTEWIVEESEFVGVDLTVMATHDRGGPDRWLHGSVAEAVVRRSTIPVMLVKGTADGQLAQRFEVGNPVLIVPLDGSDLADGALPAAAELASATGARIILVAVVPKPGQLVAGQGGAIVTFTGSDHTALQTEAGGYLETRAALMTEVTGVETIVRYGAAAAEISAVADECSAAAVVMATHGRTGPIRSMLGSVAGKVVHGASVPVVLIHPSEVQPIKPLTREALLGPVN